MAKSGSFTGSTSPSQSKFLPVIYWSTDRDFSNNRWVVNVYVNYKCYDLYLGSIESKYITITVNGGGTKSPASKAISDSNSKMHEGRWIDTQTFYIPFSGHDGWTSASLSFNMSYVRNLNYSGVTIKSCSGSGTVQLETAYTACGAPTSVTASPTNPKRGETVTLSWSGAKGGTANSINGYELEYRVGSGNWIAWKSVSSTATYSSTTDSWQQPVGQTGQYRVKTKGSAGSNYYSGWAYSNTITIANSAPTMNSVSRNTSLVPYNNGNGGTASFSWSGSDVDGDTLRYAYKLSTSSSFSAYTTETSKGITVKGSQGATVTLTVKANDYKVDSGTKTSSAVQINKVPDTPIITFVNSSGTTITPNAKPTSLYYKLVSKQYYSGSLTFNVYLEVSNTSSFPSSPTSYYLGNYSGNVYIDLQDNSGPSRYIGVNQYYRIRVRAYDGYDYSSWAYSAIKQKNAAPNYDANLVNSFDDTGIKKLDSVYWELADGRLRKGNVVNNKVILNWTMPDTTGQSNLKYVKIYRNISNDSSITSWTLILTRNVSSTMSTTYTDTNIGTTGARINYKLIFEDEYGWVQQDSTAEILTLFRNNNPVFVNSYIKLNRVSSTGAPTIKVYNNESVDVAWAKTNGDSDDDAILLTPNGGTASSYMSTPNKFKISLVFDYDPFISLSGGYPQNTSGANITEIVLAENVKATTDDVTYNRHSLNFTPSVFENYNFSNISKRQQYSKVTIQIESEDTYGKKSTNKLSTPIILDFRQKPVLDSDLTKYTIQDGTNNITIAKLGETITTEPNAYTSDKFYMINSGEHLLFKFPKAISPNAPSSGDDGIYSYLIYYAVSTSNVTNQDFKLLKEIPKSQLTLSGDSYIYDHTVSNYSVNNYVKFAISAKDTGYGKTEAEKRENALEGTKIELPYTMMVCRATNPSISLNNLDFDTSSTEEKSRVRVNFTISDLGGSRSPGPNNQEVSSYWMYRNFERFASGRFFYLDLLLSETEDFSSYTRYSLNEVVLDSTHYPPEPGQKNDDEKQYAYPWSNYEVETPSNQLIETGKSYYAKLTLQVGYRKNSTPTSNYLYAETPITFLRSLRATLTIRDKKIGVNTKEPECTFHVSAGNSIEEQNNWVQFDSGIEDEQVVRFDLLTGHMVLGIIDCGRII